MSEAASVEALVTELRRAFRHAAEAEAWLDTPVPALGRDTPRALLRSGEIARVTAALYAFNAGVTL